MRKRPMRVLLLAAFAAIAACHDPFVEQAEAAAPAKLDRTTVQVVTSDGKSHSYKVEIARTPEEQARGLMFRRSMPRDAGMLFPFDPPRPASFWMENTHIPLDIIFIGPDGRIQSIARNTATLSDAPIHAAPGPVRLILEINAGVSEQLGITPGDRVTHRLLP